MNKRKYRKFYQYYICGLKDLNVYYIVIVQILKNMKSDKEKTILKERKCTIEEQFREKWN